MLDSSDESNRSVVIYDSNAMVEFHYDEQGHGRDEKHAERDRKNKYQRVPDSSTNKHLGIDFGAAESATVPSLAEQPSLPPASASDTLHSAWNSAVSNKQ